MLSGLSLLSFLYGQHNGFLNFFPPDVLSTGDFVNCVESSSRTATSSSVPEIALQQCCACMIGCDSAARSPTRDGAGCNSTAAIVHPARHLELACGLYYRSRPYMHNTFGEQFQAASSARRYGSLSLSDSDSCNTCRSSACLVGKNKIQQLVNICLTSFAAARVISMVSWLPKWPEKLLDH